MSVRLAVLEHLDIERLAEEPLHEAEDALLRLEDLATGLAGLEVEVEEAVRLAHVEQLGNLGGVLGEEPAKIDGSERRDGHLLSTRESRPGGVGRNGGGGGGGGHGVGVLVWVVGEGAGVFGRWMTASPAVSEGLLIRPFIHAGPPANQAHRTVRAVKLTQYGA